MRSTGFRTEVGNQHEPNFNYERTYVSGNANRALTKQKKKVHHLPDAHAGAQKYDGLSVLQPIAVFRL